VKIAELKNLSQDELKQKYTSLQGELFTLRNQGQSGNLEKPHRIKLIKRDIARILTLLKQKG
jgi:large subunit ribosomal protein L29